AGAADRGDRRADAPGAAGPARQARSPAGTPRHGSRSGWTRRPRLRSRSGRPSAWRAGRRSPSTFPRRTGPAGTGSRRLRAGSPGRFGSAAHPRCGIERTAEWREEQHTMRHLVRLSSLGAAALIGLTFGIPTARAQEKAPAAPFEPNVQVTVTEEAFIVKSDG